MLLPIDHLYTRLPEYYAAFSNDRDFKAEVEFLTRLCAGPEENSRNNFAFLELFAGPAAHCAAWNALGIGSAHAIDAHAAMRDFSVDKGNCLRENYHISSLPELPAKLLNNFLRFDLIFAPRFSVCYLSPDDLCRLFANLRAICAEQGKLVLELHTNENISNLFASIDIKARVVEFSDGRILRCDWPAAEPSLIGDNRVLMPISIEVLQGGQQISFYAFESKEYLHSIDSISNLLSSSEFLSRSYHVADVFQKEHSTLVSIEIK